MPAPTTMPRRAAGTAALLWLAVGLLAMAAVGAADDFPFTFGAVTGYRVQGDRATATGATEPLDFVPIAGRWYLTPPATP